jgi:ligand-binding SRPBCC domain-containing protein
MIITYFVRPLLNIPQTWVTEITHVNQPNYFVDEQRFGPYKFWHHQHSFTKTEDGGVIMDDIVSYVIPFGFLGRIINYFIVSKKVKEIFDYRKTVLEKMFV